MNNNDDRYFLKAGDGPYHETDADGFKRAERAAGFRPHGGGDGFATSGFGSHAGVTGMIIGCKWFDPDADLSELGANHPYQEILASVNKPEEPDWQLILSVIRPGDGGLYPDNANLLADQLEAWLKDRT